MAPALAAEKAAQIEAVRKEALETAISVTKQKVREQIESERQAAKSETGAFSKYLLCPHPPRISTSCFGRVLFAHCWYWCVLFQLTVYSLMVISSSYGWGSGYLYH